MDSQVDPGPAPDLESLSSLSFCFVLHNFNQSKHSENSHWSFTKGRFKPFSNFRFEGNAQTLGPNLAAT